jgi:[acyl-carrier-protein] S-malonyltransferase
VLWEELRSLLPAPAGGAGHSLGEYTALAAAQAMDFETGLRLVGVRSRAMAAASDLEPSGMAALLGADIETAEAVASARRELGGRLYVANLNAPGQVVLAGGADDLDWLAEHGVEFGVRKVLKLSVAGAYHSPFMTQAAEDLATALEGFTPAALAFPVWSNVTAETVTESDIAGLLLRHLVSPVRFADSLMGMAAAGIDHFVHVGPGDVTAGLARRSVPGAHTTVVSSLEEVGRAGESIVTIANSGGSL